MNPIQNFFRNINSFFIGLGEAIFFLFDIIGLVLRGKIRLGEVMKQIFEQGLQSVVIIALSSFCSGAVLAMQGHVMLNRFGAKEYVAQLVALSLVRELSPVFSSFIFSGKAGAKIAAELGAMNVNNQIVATKTLGVDPIEYLVVPRMAGCFIVLPILVVFSMVIGIFGGYIVGVFEANIPGPFYVQQTLKAISFDDFLSGFAKSYCFAILIGWICCYQGYFAKGGSLGVGKFTTKAVAYSYIFVVLSNVVLTKLILTLEG